MTRKEMEERIKNLELAVFNDAVKASTKSTALESNIDSMEGKVTEVEDITATNTSSISDIEDAILEISEVLYPVEGED